MCSASLPITQVCIAANPQGSPDSRRTRGRRRAKSGRVQSAAGGPDGRRHPSGWPETVDLITGYFASPALWRRPSSLRGILLEPFGCLSVPHGEGPCSVRHRRCDVRPAAWHVARPGERQAWGAAGPSPESTFPPERSDTTSPLCSPAGDDEEVELSSFRLPLGRAIGLQSGPSVVPHLQRERTCIIQKSDCCPQ